MNKQLLLGLIIGNVCMLQAADIGSSSGSKPLIGLKLVPQAQEAVIGKGKEKAKEAYRFCVFNGGKEIVSCDAESLKQSQTLANLLEDCSSSKTSINDILKYLMQDFSEHQIKLWVRGLEANESPEKAEAYVANMKLSHVAWLMDKANFFHMEQLLNACAKRLACSPQFKIESLAHEYLENRVMNQLDQHINNVKEVVVKTDPTILWSREIICDPHTYMFMISLCYGKAISEKIRDFAHERVENDFNNLVKKASLKVKDAEERELLLSLLDRHRLFKKSKIEISTMIAYYNLQSYHCALYFEDKFIAVREQSCFERISLPELQDLSFKQKQLVYRASERWDVGKAYVLQEDELDTYEALPEGLKNPKLFYYENKTDYASRAICTWVVKQLFNQKY